MSIRREQNTKLYLILFFLHFRTPRLFPLRLEYPLMIPRIYHRQYCLEMLGIQTLPGSSFPRADPERVFSRARNHVTDTRLDPKIFSPTGERTKFSEIGKGDKVAALIGVETFPDGKREVGIKFVLRQVRILEKGRGDVKEENTIPGTRAGDLQEIDVPMTRTI